MRSGQASGDIGAGAETGIDEIGAAQPDERSGIALCRGTDQHHRALATAQHRIGHLGGHAAEPALAQVVFEALEQAGQVREQLGGVDH